MKKTSLKEKTSAELSKLLVDSREELRTIRFNAAGARAKDPNAASALRKNIARALTELHARAGSAEVTPSAA